VLPTVAGFTGFLILGGAGTGKSFMLNSILDVMRSEKLENAAFTAYMGIATQQLPKPSSTICTLFSLNPNIVPPNGNPWKPMTPAQIAVFESIAGKAATLTLLASDEISCTDTTLISGINQRLQQLRGNNLPFGGLLFIASGDFEQKQPVGGLPLSKALVLASDIEGDLLKQLAIFKQANAQYTPPRLVLFSGVTPTSCGTGQAAAGPFYCPNDKTVYIDLSFYQMLQQKFQAPGDFAQAYVVAHEVGHHIQNLMGTMQKVQGMQQRSPEKQSNLLSVRLELQADCYAGVWAHHSQKARGWLDKGDIEAGLNAASQIGDDKMMKRSQGVVVPDAFTHGSSQQRTYWFGTGMKTGDLRSCDTFTQTTP
jgi:hypothetical protein